MMDTEFLLRLLNISGVSGNEMEATLLCKKYMPSQCHMHQDVMGNLIVNIPDNGESTRMCTSLLMRTLTKSDCK